MSTVSTERLATIFVDVADTMISEFDLAAFLQMLTDHTAELVDDATAGLLLGDPHGPLHFMAASDQTTRSLEIFQADKQDGPCVEAFHGGQPVVNTDLRAASGRWPQFAPRAAADGFRCVHTFPLRLRNDTIGALEVFGTAVGDFDTTDVHIVQALADIAAISLLQQRSIAHGEVLNAQLHGALNSRIIIEQAKGVIAQAHGVNVDVAFKVIRAYARRTRQPLSGVANQVVTGLNTLPAPAKPS